MSDLREFVVALHGKRRLVVDMEATTRGEVRWDATLSGEDFLDGPWEISAMGIERDRKRAMRAVRRRFE